MNPTFKNNRKILLTIIQPVKAYSNTTLNNNKRMHGNVSASKISDDKNNNLFNVRLRWT